MKSLNQVLVESISSQIKEFKTRYTLTLAFRNATEIVWFGFRIITLQTLIMLPRKSSLFPFYSFRTTNFALSFARKLDFEAKKAFFFRIRTRKLTTCLFRIKFLPMCQTSCQSFATCQTLNQSICMVLDLNFTGFATRKISVMKTFSFNRR